MFSLIVAFDENRGIGKDNQIPWHLKEDMKLFKANTINKKILMGNNTFKSIGKPLPNRHSIVVSHNLNDKENKENLTYIDDLDNYLLANKDTDEEIMICGGSSVYLKALPYCKYLYISHVLGKHDVDTYFPIINFDDYKIIKEENHDGFVFKKYVKKD